MGTGLTMTIEEFRALPQRQKLDCLYQNQVETLSTIRGYKLQYKVSSIIGTLLVSGMGWLFYIILQIRKVI